jgi:hypothetical protein
MLRLIFDHMWLVQLKEAMQEEKIADTTQIAETEQQVKQPVTKIISREFLEALLNKTDDYELMLATLAKGWTLEQIPSNPETDDYLIPTLDYQPFSDEDRELLVEEFKKNLAFGFVEVELEHSCQCSDWLSDQFMAFTTQEPGRILLLIYVNNQHILLDRPIEVLFDLFRSYSRVIWDKFLVLPKNKKPSCSYCTAGDNESGGASFKLSIL